VRPVIKKGIGKHGQRKINSSPTWKCSEKEIFFCIGKLVIKCEFRFMIFEFATEFQQVTQTAPNSVPVYFKANFKSTAASQNTLRHGFVAVRKFAIVANSFK